jgi:hypothetical protein
MRLDFRNIGKGLEAIAGAKQARDLAQESARYDVTEGAYGPGLQENIQQLEGLKAQDPAQAPAYDQAIAELTRRQGLTAPDYSVASGAQNYGTRQEARQAAAPMRAEGLAGVYRRYGDVAQADTLEARAYEQQRALAAEGRATAREARDIKAFDTQQAAAQQQGLLTGAQLTDIQRKQNLQAALDARLADINQQEFAKPEMRTQAILSLVEELQGPQAAAQLRSSYTQQELNDISLQSKKFEEGYRQSRAKGVFSAMEWFDEQNAAFKLERDPKNPFRVIQVNQDGSRQLFADAKNERELGMIVDAKAKPGGFLELAKYDLDVKKADAAIATETARAGYYANASGEKGLTKKVQDVESLLGRKLSEPEKLTLFGISAKPSDRPEVSASAVADYAAKLIGKPSGEMKDGKAVKYTAETAAAAARRALSSQAATAADPADALIEAMRRNAPTQQQATSAGQSLVNLSNAMLPPAAPVQTAPTTRQEQLRGLYLGQPRQQ